jgi:signal transduction histidine kinase
VPSGMWLELRGAVSSDVKLPDCRFAFKQLLGREGEPLGSPLVSFLRGVRYLSTPFLSVSITRRDLWPALIDPSQIELVILNLAINARDAMASRGGRLTIATSNVGAADPKRPPDLGIGEHVVLSVIDNGKGMTE